MGGVVAGGGIFYATNLETVPYTDRRRFNCISAATEKQMGEEVARATLQQYRGRLLPPNHPDVLRIENVLRRVLQANNLLDVSKWRLRVIDDPQTVNAFVGPSGDVFVFTGMLRMFTSPNDIAAVLGHEIGHNIAHHPAEKMSRAWFVLGIAYLLAYTFDVSGFLASFATDLVLSLPNSRTLEAEADHIGLLLMAQACYDPKAAIGFWQRMAKAEKYAPPQMLSTHPHSLNRAKTIQDWIPEAESKRADAGCSDSMRLLGWLICKPGIKRHITEIYASGSQFNASVDRALTFSDDELF